MRMCEKLQIIVMLCYWWNDRKWQDDDIDLTTPIKKSILLSIM